MLTDMDFDLFAKQWDTTPLTAGNDPLALTVGSWRRAVATDYQVRWDSLADASRVPTAEDLELAQRIRAHYRGQLTLRALRTGRPLTSYQQALYEMLETQCYQNQHLGMLYRLPYFYAEDTAHEQLRMTCARVPDQREHKLCREIRVLTPLREILRSRRQKETMEYWFVDAQGHGAAWMVGLGNPLRSLVHALFQRPDVAVSAYFPVRIGTIRPGDAWAHFCIEQPELA
jgi:hypothetical protein